MRTGIIDIGTNTFHLLIAEQREEMVILHQEKVSVRIGQGGITKGLITQDAIERAITTLSEFKQKLEEFEVDSVFTTGTSAVRSAQNKEEFVKIIRQKTGLEVEVLSGDDEAFLIHKGVSQFVDFGNETGLIVDIGGGSIEFIIADGNEIKWLKSYEIGGQRLIDQFHKSDPITEGEISTLNHFLEITLAEVYAQCAILEATFLVGSSGSFDTFWDIHVGRENAAMDPKPILTKNQFLEIYALLKSKKREDRLKIPGMIPMRVDMIVGASVVTKNILNNCNFDYMKVSPFALKEGVLSFGLPKSE